ncbi:DUF842 domain containing protein [Trichuris trichiura]|uniref:DUF842 domain containing protein n=1 Tax=Trichuris trichiura TaxID=36087 RepID=A0A077ZCM2_TRITR|nr:DUF842 domain containing protein [Trichuris trichiura]
MLLKLIEDIDKTHIRPLQQKMYSCASKCCSDTSGNMQSVQTCISRCSSQTEKIGAYIQAEMEKLQNRVQRCEMACQDEVQDKATSANEKPDRKMLENCIAKCADDCLRALPNFRKRIVEYIENSN